VSENEGTKLTSKPLTGTDFVSIDAKGRLPLGAKTRQRLGEQIAICRGRNGCVCIYPQAKWDALLADINACPPNSKWRQAFEDLIMPTVEDDLTCDDAGRVLIPARMRNLAGLTGKVIVKGCNDRLEVSPDREDGSHEMSNEEYAREYERRYDEMMASRSVAVGAAAAGAGA